MAKLMRIAMLLVVATALFPGREAAAQPRIMAGESPATYRHADRVLDSALRFVAETVTEDSRRLDKPTYRVTVADFCTLRFDRLDAGGMRVPVHVVDLSHLDPAESELREGMGCLETTSLRNRIVRYELPVNPDWTYAFDGSPVAGTRALADRFCFYVSYWHSHRVSRALSRAMASCDARTVW